MGTTHPDSLIQAVASALGLAPADLTGPSRRRDIAQARQLAAYLIHLHCPTLSQEAIGEYLGGREHTTISHALRRAPEILATQPAIRTRLAPFLPGAPVQQPTAWRDRKAMRWWATQSRSTYHVAVA